MESAAISCDDEEKWEAEAETEEEEEEALSLCDLPVNLIKEENQIQTGKDEDGESKAIKTEEDFNFGSLGGSVLTEPEMCAADEVFFKGQILPLRLSVSSDSGLVLVGCRQDSQNSTSRCLSRSESMDHGSLTRFTSVSSSSRSSSTRSSSNNSSITVTPTKFNSVSNSNYTNKSSKPIKIRNNFNTQPSPKPHLRLSKTRPVNVMMSSRNQKSSMWDFFRLGLVRAPELELQDLKVRSNNNINANRNSVSRNSSCNSSDSSSSTKNSTSKIGTEVAIKNQQDSNTGNFIEKRIGLFSGCKCSVNAVETVPLNKIGVIKSNKKSEKDKALMSSHSAMEDKKKLLQELKMKKMKAKGNETEKEKKQEGKQALSRHRTFEWLKELSVSHASYVDEA